MSFHLSIIMFKDSDTLTGQARMLTFPKWRGFHNLKSAHVCPLFNIHIYLHTTASRLIFVSLLNYLDTFGFLFTFFLSLCFLFPRIKTTSTFIHLLLSWSQQVFFFHYVCFSLVSRSFIRKDFFCCYGVLSFFFFTPFVVFFLVLLFLWKKAKRRFFFKGSN